MLSLETINMLLFNLVHLHLTFSFAHSKNIKYFIQIYTFLPLCNTFI